MAQCHFSAELHKLNSNSPCITKSQEHHIEPKVNAACDYSWPDDITTHVYHVYIHIYYNMPAFHVHTMQLVCTHASVYC